MQHKSDINTPMFYSVVEPVYFSCLLLPSVEVEGHNTTTTSNEKQQFVGRLRSTVTTLSRSDFLKHGCTLGCPKLLTFLKSSPARSFSQLTYAKKYKNAKKSPKKLCTSDGQKGSEIEILIFVRSIY